MLGNSNVFCLEGDWDENLKRRSSMLPAFNNGMIRQIKMIKQYLRAKIRLLEKYKNTNQPQ